MSWVLRDDASIDTAINTTRLPSPNAATSHVLSRMWTSKPTSSTQRTSSDRRAGIL